MRPKRRWTVLTRPLRLLGASYYLVIPKDLIRCLGWKRGDLIRFTIEERGKITLEKIIDIEEMGILEEQKVNQTQIEQK